MKYVYYILSNNEKLDKLKTGVGIPNITKGTLENLIIPVPSIERQKEIIEYCECNDIIIKQLEKEIENNKRVAHQFIRGIVKTQIQTDEKEEKEEKDDNKEDEETKEAIIEPKPKPKTRRVKKLVEEKEDNKEGEETKEAIIEPNPKLKTKRVKKTVEKKQEEPYLNALILYDYYLNNLLLKIMKNMLKP